MRTRTERAILGSTFCNCFKRRLLDSFEGSMKSLEKKILRRLENLESRVSKIERKFNLVSSKRGDLAIHKGTAETSIIIKKLEDSLLRADFFKIARSTADVRSKLKEETGVDFLSRKVSQALGDLYRMKTLGRTGSKGNFKYIRP